MQKRIPLLAKTQRAGIATRASGIRRLSKSTEEFELSEKSSHILGAKGEMSAAQLKRTIVDLQKATASQAEKFWPAMQRTFAEIAPLLPQGALNLAVQHRGVSSAGELALDVFRKTVFVPRTVFNELRTHNKDLKTAGAFYFEGYCVIPVDKGSLKRIVLFPVVHEWVHTFDAATGLERSQKAKEGLAYGVDLFVRKTTSNMPIKPQRISEGNSKEYMQGFYLGKNVASMAAELAKRRGTPAAQTFFHELFLIGEFDAAKAYQIKERLLQ